ncbi:FAD-dependent thymidylate synthase [Sporosarcina sp. E16_3]|uniref:FAD-dependent thymidylate synthase n=1 Tax=Sporosarcina sp. E16_3 TaxID=2789293 RepID=UPI001A92B6DE|nr:FAD-dependent thymidylate synthase [Sporosarcina sp. E16_3]MBO0602723.1 FAD-dependent thymidylate synthase [Sporosarcina sp. E16_3]
MTKTIEPQRINVLDDKGYVILHDVMGSDLSVVNAARVSYDKKSEALTDGDRRLIAFLARERHTSPFRHAFLQFEIYAPLMISRQWHKHIIGSDHSFNAHNESSRRYITEEAAFHIPEADAWRSKPANSKQGSGATLDVGEGTLLTKELRKHVEQSERLYEDAMANGVAPEQARLFLPAYSMYVRWYWSASLAAVCHMLNQRLASDSQYEFQLYAKAVLELIKPHFPVSIDALVKDVDA